MKITTKEYYSRISSKTSRPSYWHEPSTEPLLPLTIGQLVDWAAEVWGDEEALVSVYENYRITFKEARDKADELAAGFLTLGLKHGDRLAIWSFNSSVIYLTSLAAARIGVILARIDPNNQATELTHCLKKVGAKALLVLETGTNRNYFDILQSVVPEISTCEPGKLSSELFPELKTVIFKSDKDYAGTYSYENVFRLSSPEVVDNIRNSQDSIQPDDGATIHYTSGTTATAKGVLISHHTLVNNSDYLMSVWKPSGKTHRFLTQMQLCHIGANIVAFVPGLLTGSTIVIPSMKFDVKSSLNVIEKERCTCIMGTPAMYVDLIDYMERNRIQLRNTIQYGLVGAAPITQQVLSRIMSWLPVQEIHNVYGMTEVGLVCLNIYKNDENGALTSTSTISSHYEVKVVDDDGKLVPMGTPGELLIRSYGVMLGYWDDEEKTRQTMTQDRWLKSGDQAVLKEDKSIKIVGRIKEAIIRGGDKIFPKEIEEFFLSHPDILDVQAFGVPDRRWGEEMCVCLRRKEGSELTEEKIRAYCQQRIAEFRIPRYIRFVKDFPKNTTGKIDKKKLSELVII